MPAFKDSAGRQWPVAITIAAARRVKQTLDVDLLNLDAGEPPVIQRLHDMATVVDVVYVLCMPDADAAGIDDAEFAERLDGRAAGAARNALWDALRDFFLAVGRPDAAGLLDRSNAVIAAEIAANRDAIDDPEMLAMIEETLKSKRHTLRTQMRDSLGPHRTAGNSSPSTPPS